MNTSHKFISKTSHGGAARKENTQFVTISSTQRKILQDLRVNEFARGKDAASKVQENLSPKPCLAPQGKRVANQPKSKPLSNRRLQKSFTVYDDSIEEKVAMMNLNKMRNNSDAATGMGEKTHNHVSMHYPAIVHGSEKNCELQKAAKKLPRALPNPVVGSVETNISKEKSERNWDENYCKALREEETEVTLATTIRRSGNAASCVSPVSTLLSDETNISSGGDTPIGRKTVGRSGTTLPMLPVSPTSNQFAPKSINPRNAGSELLTFPDRAAEIEQFYRRKESRRHRAIDAMLIQSRRQLSDFNVANRKAVAPRFLEHRENLVSETFCASRYTRVVPPDSDCDLIADGVFAEERTEPARQQVLSYEVQQLLKLNFLSCNNLCHLKDRATLPKKPSLKRSRNIVSRKDKKMTCRLNLKLESLDLDVRRFDTSTLFETIDSTVVDKAKDIGSK